MTKRDFEKVVKFYEWLQTKDNTSTIFLHDIPEEYLEDKFKEKQLGSAGRDHASSTIRKSFTVFPERKAEL